VSNRRIILSALVIVAIIAASAGIFLAKGTKTQQDIRQQEEITLRYLSIPGTVDSADFARELGYLKGINITSAGFTTGGPEKIMAVSAGSIEFGSSAWIPVINARSKGTKIKVIASSGGNNTKWIVLENSSIRSAKDLKGKKIAVNVLGGSVEYITREYLARNGVSKDEVQLIVIPPPQHEQALRQGQVDVVAPFDPTGEKIVAGGGVRVLFTDSDITGDISQGVYFTSEKLMNEKPDAVKRLVEAIARAEDWEKEHPKESKELAARILKNRGENSDAAKYLKDRGYREHALVTESDAQFWIEWLVKDGKIKEGQVKPSDIYTDDYNPYKK